jgi:uncharacterized protein YerC
MRTRKRNANFKLTDDQVREIRTLRLPVKRRKPQKHSLAQLAARYGVSTTTICNVVYRRQYGDVE